MFTAVVDNQIIDLDPRVPDRVSPDDKRELHANRSNIRCRGCNGQAHIRLIEDTPDPFMVFAHNPGHGAICRALGYHTDESPEHHDLKSRLAAAARKAGWEARTEVCGEKCRADVVATNPTTGTKRVLEAQVAYVTRSDVNDRTERYIHQFGGRVTWTHQGKRHWANRTKDVEALQVDDQELTTVIDGVAVDQTGTKAPPTPISDVVPGILNRQFRYIFLEDFGFYLDLAASVRDDGRRRHQHVTIPTHRGRQVSECDRPEGDGLATGRERLFAPDGRPLCVVCNRPFVPAGHDQPLPICGMLQCRARHDWGTEAWAGRARMANARLNTGRELDELDLEALLRAADPQ